MSYVSESDQTPIIFYYFNGQSDTIATEEFFGKYSFCAVD